LSGKLSAKARLNLAMVFPHVPLVKINALPNDGNEITAEVNRAFSADAFWGAMNPCGACPRLAVNSAPLALNRCTASSLPFARGLDDLGEAARIQAGPADESAVDVRLAH